MRLGKIQKGILRTLYENELANGRYYEDKNRPIKIIKKKVKYPSQDQNLRLLQYNEILTAISFMKAGKEHEPNEKLQELIKQKKAFHKKSVGVYRSFRSLLKKGLVSKLDTLYRLTEKGRRVISHRI